MTSLELPNEISRITAEILSSIKPRSRRSRRRISRNSIIEEVRSRFSDGLVDRAAFTGYENIILGRMNFSIDPQDAITIAAEICEIISLEDDSDRDKYFYLDFYLTDPRAVDFKVGESIVRDMVILHSEPRKARDCRFVYHPDPAAKSCLHDDLIDQRAYAAATEKRLSEERGVPFFNGPTLRLNRMQIDNTSAITESSKLEFYLSDCEWLDWTTQQQCLEGRTHSKYKGMQPNQIRSVCFDEKISQTLLNLEDCTVCNQLGTSTVLVSSDGCIALGKRSGGQDNLGVWGPSASENLSRFWDEPLSIDDPHTSRFLSLLGDASFSDKSFRYRLITDASEAFSPKLAPSGFACALRGVWEEFGPVLESIDPNEVVLTSVAYDRGFCVPHLFFLVESSLSKRELTEIREASPPSDEWEYRQIHWIDWRDSESVRKALFGLRWARVSKAAVIKAILYKLENEGGINSRELLEPFKLLRK